jgi:hypothetical protein
MPYGARTIPAGKMKTERIEALLTLENEVRAELE